MAVSKLCCPACWDYFDILSDSERQGSKADSKMFKIRGRHATVYPVQLPDWSHPDVVRELNKRFDGYLRSELDIMSKNYFDKQNRAKQVPRSNHRHNPSLQSVSSAITNASDNSVESNLDNFDDVPVRDVERGVKEGAHS